MIEKLIKKIIEDAEKKAEGIIRDAEKRLQELYAAEKDRIDREYVDRLRFEKEKIDSGNERRISTFRMDKEKEILAMQNGFIENVMKKMEEMFNSYLRENTGAIIASICEKMKEDDYTVTVPESSIIEIKDAKIKTDANLKNAFVVDAGKWKVVFNWESIKNTMGDTLREKIGGYFTEG